MYFYRTIYKLSLLFSLYLSRTLSFSKTLKAYVDRKFVLVFRTLSAHRVLYRDLVGKLRTSRNAYQETNSDGGELDYRGKSKELIAGINQLYFKILYYMAISEFLLISIFQPYCVFLRTLSRLLKSLYSLGQSSIPRLWSKCPTERKRNFQTEEKITKSGCKTVNFSVVNC